MIWHYEDGGRIAYGFSSRAPGDCLCRAIAIAGDLPYDEVHALIDIMGGKERVSQHRLNRYKSRNSARSSAERGVYKSTARQVLESLGFVNTPTMGIGTGCRVHMRKEELPKGRLVVSLSRHYAAVIDGELYDTFDCSRNGTRCVYGYWTPGNR